MGREGIYTGTIIARSSETPTTAALLFYTVRIQVGHEKPLEFENMKPPASRRWTLGNDTLNLIPFELGERIAVHLVVQGNKDLLYMETGEIPENGECEAAP